MYYLKKYDSPIGNITLVCDDENLLGLWNEDQKYFGATIPGDTVEREDTPVFNLVSQWLDDYFAGVKPDVSKLPLAPKGSEFRQMVWQLLLEIPYGEVVSYGDIAAKMAEKMNRVSMSSQAVGGAVGHNPISIIIPCHRVVGSNGSLTGYAGGIDMKISLLELEGVDTSKFTIPTVGTAL